MEVPERLAADAQTGLTGKFVTNARPGLTHDLKIDHVEPNTSLQRARNVYIARAQVKMPQPWVRSGMEGVAKVNVGKRRVWWIALHRIVDYIRLNFY